MAAPGQHTSKGHHKASSSAGKLSLVIDIIASIAVISITIAFARFWNLPEMPGWLWAIILAGVATAAYRLRTTQRRMYGVVEIMVGLVTALFAFAPEVQSIERLIRIGVFVGAIYLAVGGLESVREGLSEKSQNKWDRWWKR